MILTIDAGNTNTSFGLMEAGQVIYLWRFPNDPKCTPDMYASKLLPLLRHADLFPEMIAGAILCSVVPEVNDALQAFVKKYFKQEILMAGSPNAPIPVTSLVDRAEAVGDDRLVNFYAASLLYGGPLLVADFGTAMTLDFTDEKGNHMGGVIAPGAGLVAYSLSEAGALLPKLPLQKPDSVIGSWTIPAMQSGVFWGYVGLFEGLMHRMMDEFKEIHGAEKGSPRVVVTGGLARVFKDVTELFEVYDPDLMMKGLYFVYENSLKLKNI